MYGTHSTKYFLQEDVFLNSQNQRDIDTILDNKQSYNYQYTNNTWHQYQGNLGTSMKPLYYKTPEEIGYRLGFEAFHPYLNTTKNQRYYDTKSPYTELKYVQGTTNEQHLYLMLTRNVNQYWNLGASYNRFTSAKQYAIVQARDFHADHHQINVFSSVKSKNDKYRALVHFNYMQHWLYENGGIKPQPDLDGVIDSGLYIYKYADVCLQRTNALAARNYYKTTNLHLFHQYNPLDSGNTALQLFHEADWKRENQYFRDRSMGNDSTFRTYYGGVYFKDTVATNFKYNYELFQNKFGLKGTAGKLFYSLHYKTRLYSVAQQSQDTNSTSQRPIWLNDAFGGADLVYRQSDDLSMALSGEGLLSFASSNHVNKVNYNSYNDYRLKASLKLKKFDIELGQYRQSPTLMQTRNVNNLSAWSHMADSMQAVLSRHATVSYLYTSGSRYLKLGLHYQRVDNLIYFAKGGTGADSLKVKPIQDDKYIDYIQPQIGFRVNWRTLFLENDLILTNVFTSRELIHMPRWYTMPKFYYQSYLFKKATQVQAGVEVFLKADYYADDYAPQLNQYFWQEKTVVKTFPITHFFLNFQISRATIFLKLTNAFGGQAEQSGYMETPYYTGMRRSFQFGVYWRAFN